MTDKERIRQYLDFKGISKNKFYSQTGLSVGFLDSGKSLGLDKARIIINTYPDICLEWLMMGTGPMIHSQEAHAPAQSIPAPEHTSSDDKLLTLIEKQAAKIEAQALEIGRLRERISLISNNIHSMRGGDFAIPISTPDFPIGPLPQNTSADTPEE